MGARTSSLLVAAAIGLACGLHSAFECSTDADCISSGLAGTCEPVGYCSFPDDACDSGHRFGTHAGAGLGGTCVEPDGPGSSDTTATSTSTATTSTTSSDSTTVGVEAGNDSTTTSPTSTEPPTSTTTPGSTSAADETTTTDSTDSTTGPNLTCDLDTFDAGIDASWCEYEDPGTAIAAMNGTLVCEVFQAGFQGGGAYAGISTCDFADLTGIVATIEVVQAPAPEPELVVLMELYTASDRIGIDFQEGLIEAYSYDGNFTTHGSAFYDPNLHRHWRLEDVGGAVSVQTSPDASAWDELAVIDDTNGLLPDAKLVITCGAELQPSMDTTAIVDDAEICLPR